MWRGLYVLVVLAACDATEPEPDQGRPATTGVGGTDETCVLPNVALTAAAGPGGANIVPATMTADFDGVFVAGQPYDYRGDADGDGALDDVSASVTFRVNDSGGAELCTVTWDMSDSGLGTTWKTPSGLDLSAKWRLKLDPAAAVSTCPPLDAAVYGFATVPEVLASVPIDLGIGELVSLLPDVQIALAAAGENFVADWSPYIMGTYLKVGASVTEIGYTRGSEAPCEGVVDNRFVDAPDAGLALPRGRFSNAALRTVAFPAGSIGGGTTTETVTGDTDFEPIGSFKIEDGPNWTTNPPVYSCIEACALLFGGDASEYHCSTNQNNLNFQSYVSGWGDATFCNSPKDEDYSKGTNYNCGSAGCAYSAYVLDNCNSGEKNYCWK